MDFLSRAKDEGVVVEERQRIGGQLVQFRVLEPKGRLRVTRRLLLAKDVGHIVGAEGSARLSFLDGHRYGLRAVVAEEI
jgi:hypothetical protein